MTDGIAYEPTRDHWTPYEPWMRDLLADDARVSWIDRVSRRVTRDSWRYGAEPDSDKNNKADGLRIHPDDVPERPTEDDPDEALAKALRLAWAFLPGFSFPWEAITQEDRDEYLNLARAAREHIEVERDEWKARHAALRADVAEVARRDGPTIADRMAADRLGNILDRDTERGEQA